MTTMNISLPESLKEFVKDRCEQSDFSNPSDYMRTLIREDKKCWMQEKLEALLLRGLESGESLQVDEEYLAQKRTELLERHGQNIPGLFNDI